MSNSVVNEHIVNGMNIGAMFLSSHLTSITIITTRKDNLSAYVDATYYVMNS